MGVLQVSCELTDVRFDQADAFNVAAGSNSFKQRSEVALKLIDALAESEEALIGADI